MRDVVMKDIYTGYGKSIDSDDDGLVFKFHDDPTHNEQPKSPPKTIPAKAVKSNTTTKTENTTEQKVGSFNKKKVNKYFSSDDIFLLSDEAKYNLEKLTSNLRDKPLHQLDFLYSTFKNIKWDNEFAPVNHIIKAVNQAIVDKEKRIEEALLIQFEQNVSLTPSMWNDNYVQKRLVDAASKKYPEESPLTIRDVMLSIKPDKVSNFFNKTREETIISLPELITSDDKYSTISNMPENPLPSNKAMQPKIRQVGFGI